MAAVDTVLNIIKEIDLAEGDRLPSERKLADPAFVMR